jgi:ligand-binding sensor domain-containing protein/serine phosphatase RsbU (regulator of sigma subunit)
VSFHFTTAFASGKGDIPNFTIREGLSNNSVTVIFQDSFGFLWIGTEDGLNRYDGYKFKTFRHDPLDENSISGNHILAITQDKNNDLWIGTRNSGLNKLDYSTGKFSCFLANPDSVNSLPENAVFGLLVDSHGRLWVKTQTYLSLFKGEANGFENFGHFNNLFNVTEISKAPLIQESDTSLLIGTKDGLNRFNILNRHFTRFSDRSDDGFSCQATIYDILPCPSDSDKYLVASSTGLKLLQIGDSVLFDQHFSLSPAGEDLTINELLYFKKGSVFAATNRGIVVINSKTGRRMDFPDPRGREISNHITTIIKDRSGIIWAGSRFTGVFKINLSPPKFHALSCNSKQPVQGDLTSCNFQSIYQDEDGSLWLATIDSGILRYYPETSKVRNYFIQCEKDAHAKPVTVYELYKDHSGRLWAGSNCGLFYLDRVEDKFIEFENELDFGVENLLQKNHIYALKNDFDGNLWIGTRFGLYRFDGRNVFSYFSDNRDTTGLLSDHINALCLDEEGNLWIGTSDGLNYLEHESKKIRSLPFIGRNGVRLKTSVLSINLSYHGKILVGTRSGVWEVVSPGFYPQLIQGNSELENDMIKAVVSDNTNRTWVSTNKGIACINPDGTVYNFDIVDGLPGYVFNSNSVFKNRAGTLFFGSTEGLCWFHPDSIEYNLTKPLIALTNISVTQRGENSNIYWPNCKELEIKYRPFTSIEIEYSGLEFTQPSKNRYKVFLEGYDSDWRPVTSKNKVSFSNLLPGNYTLKIIASNNDFMWNNDPFELKIVVKPPLWMSNYAIVFYILALIFVINLFINYRIRHYRQANKELQEKTVNKRQIEAQREVLTRINRNLTDSINYARRIQRAMLPSEASYQNVFPESFVYLRARDIVSGDFFWFLDKGEKIFVTAVDCTGHGVSGAFMSIIGIDLLKNIVEIQGVESPSTILKTMNNELIRTLHREQPSESFEFNISDGMDMAMLVIDRKNKKLTFSGAYNGFYLVRENEIHSYKGDRFPLGYLKEGESPVFTEKEIMLKEDDVIYLFSDGLPDQFGGPEHKKFKYRRFRLLLLNIHRLSFSDQKAILHQRIEEWMNGENEQVDDMLVIGFKPLK